MPAHHVLENADAEKFLRLDRRAALQTGLNIVPPGGGDPFDTAGQVFVYVLNQ